MTILCKRNLTKFRICTGRPEDFAVERQKFFSYNDPLLSGSFFVVNAVMLSPDVEVHGSGLSVFVKGASLSLSAAACGLALRLRKLARSASRSRSALIRSLSSASFANAASLLRAVVTPARCQIAGNHASRLTLSPSLRIGPHLRYCCCSSVVERVIGNDEVGSSILPSSTSLSAGKSKTYCRSAFRRGTFGPGPCAYLTFKSGDAPAIQLSFHKQPFCENGMRMTTRPTANIIFVVDHHDTKQEL